MHKKILTVVGITILFLVIAVAPLTQGIVTKGSNHPLSDGNILYVGGSGEGNYTKIQDAIDNASDGDTVFVYNDSSPYYENVIVDKSINLLGEDKNSTKIDGNYNGDVVLILKNNVNITGFTIRKSGSSDRDAGVEIQSKYNRIYENIISFNEEGIRVEGSIGNNISSNMLVVRDYGIILNGSEENNVYNNYIDMRDSGLGISLFSSSNNNIVSKNTIVDGWSGIFINGDNNDINNNNLLNNFANCLGIIGNNNLIYKNNISAIYTGIIIGRSSKNNDIYENDIKSCALGVELIGAKDSDVYENDIKSCIIGVNLIEAKNNNIHRNNIIECNDGLFYSEYSIKNRIYENNFIDNENHGSFVIYLREIPLIIFLRNKWDRNYWGEPLSSPKVIKGFIVKSKFSFPYYTKLYPSYQFDWRPAKEPYDL